MWLKHFFLVVWHNGGMKWIVGCIIGLVMVAILGYGLYWYAAENVSWMSVGGGRNSTVVALETQGIFGVPATADPNYEQKYKKAVKLLSDKGLEDLTVKLVVVDISEQKEYVFSEDGSLIAVYKISTGSALVYAEGAYQNRAMGESIWRIATKVGYSLGVLYGPRLMMMDRYVDGAWTKTNVALHGTNEPQKLGTPYTLGCVCHDNTDIIALYDLLDIGMFVVAIE